MERSKVADASLAGTVVAGTYRMERLLGEGGMGVVWEAAHLRVPKRVAVKVLHTVPDPSQFARFRQEAEVTSRLRHPNIVDILDFDTLPDGTPCMVMELLEGESLATRLRRPMSVEETLEIVRQIAAGLSAAHAADVVHRDLKPDNVFLEATPGAPTVAKILDFGISKVHGSVGVVTQEDVVLGTPQYMAPEQASGDNDLVDGRADQFALAVMAYQMLSGTLPFTGTRTTEIMFKIVYESPPPLATVAPDVPPDVVAAVERAMSKRAQDRFDDLSAFVEALTGKPLPFAERPSADRMNVRTKAVGPALATPSKEAATVSERRAPTPESGSAPTSAQRGRVLSPDAAPTSAERLRPDVRDDGAGAAERLRAGMRDDGAATLADASTAPTRPARGRMIAIAASVVALGAIAVAAIATRNTTRDTTTQVQTPPRADAEPPTAASDALAIASADTQDAARLTGEALHLDAGVPSGSAATPTPAIKLDAGVVRTQTPKGPKLPPEVAAELAAGEAALKAGDLEEANASARRVLRLGSYPGAYMLLTVVACSRRDLSAAQGWLRQLVADQHPAARARCARVGFKLD